jgi:hypothetical protein
MMRRKVLVSLLCSLSLASGGCENRAATQSITTASQAKRSPRDFWKETFEREQKAAGDEREASAPPKKIDGIGEEAYWTSNRFGGILYV